MREQAYINVSGAAVNSNKTGSFFEVNAPQYTSYYKTNQNLSILPVQAHFNSSKYRTKKPIPSNNTYVSIEGFLESVETDSCGCPTKGVSELRRMTTGRFFSKRLEAVDYVSM